MMPKKFKPNQADINTFREAVKGVKPIIQDKIRLKSAAKPRQRTISPDKQEEVFKLSESLTLPLVQGEEFILYKQASVSNKILRKLRKGQYNVDAILDLHGMTIDKARVAVDHFIQQCLLEHVQVGLIIHGKGHPGQMPRLKNKLNHWLREINWVLAFCSAGPTHGRHGAIYVLLKRAGEENLS